MSIINDAFEDLFPEKSFEDFNFRVNYNDRFKPYNANVKYTGNSFVFNLSKKWKNVSREIQIGLMQELLLKAFKEKKSTFNIDLYNSFMKKIHIAAPKTRIDSFLEESFDRVNEKYFLGMVEKTNLVWHNSIRRLGSYEYGSDTISISKVLEKDLDALDYVMHHEMLHKKLKFDSSNGSCRHHTKAFREMEKRFENSQQMEERLKSIARHGIRRRFLLFG
ncbi:SprT-like domain-containing protein [Candidatus Woesearchaeota archaeon]|nr:SprT-like domain-containing protein [Candidatus Woesearchaeota archaeon]